MNDSVSALATEARRALVLHDRPLVVDLITLTLNHGVFVVRAAGSLAEAEAILAEWSPNISVIDMDHDGSTALLQCGPRPRRSAPFGGRGASGGAIPERPRAGRIGPRVLARLSPTALSNVPPRGGHCPSTAATLPAIGPHGAASVGDLR